MKKAGGVVCLLAGYVFLATGSPFFGLTAASIFVHGLSPSVGVVFLGLLWGSIGAGLLFAGLKLCWDKEEAPEPIAPETLAGFGILFPGSAQAYAGRWLPAAAFLFLPVVVAMVCLILAALVGIVFRSNPPTFLMNLIKGVTNLAIGNARLTYFVLWIASLGEGMRWLYALPANPPPQPIPRGKASVIGLGTVIFGSTFFMLTLAGAVGGLLHGTSAIKRATDFAPQTAMPQPTPAQAPSPAIATPPPAPARDPNAALAHHHNAVALSKTNLTGAAQEWEQALALDPDVATYHYDLATAYWILGDRARAVPHYQRYLQLKPNDAYTQSIREKLASVGITPQN